jgi:uncharacterized membrane protein YkvA (DUF1232 family)
VRTLLVSLAVAVGVWLLLIGGLFLAGRRVAARQLLRAIPDMILLCRGLLRDSRVSLGSKILLGLAIVWLISPIDLVPEFLPVIGPLDDVIVVGLVLRHLLHRAGEGVIREHWRGDAATLDLVLRIAGHGRPGSSDRSGAEPAG